MCATLTVELLTRCNQIQDQWVVELQCSLIMSCVSSCEESSALINLIVGLIFSRWCLFSGEKDIPGLTDSTVPRRLGPKRASKIRKLFNLAKEDDVRQYVVRRPLTKEGKAKTVIPT